MCTHVHLHMKARRQVSSFTLHLWERISLWAPEICLSPSMSGFFHRCWECRFGFLMLREQGLYKLCLTLSTTAAFRGICAFVCAHVYTYLYVWEHICAYEYQRTTLGVIPQDTSLYFLKNLFFLHSKNTVAFIYLLCMYACHCVYGGQRITWGSPFFLPCASLGLNSCPRAWQPALSPAGPSP